ncbi:MAG: tetratricopeptide repeat protein [Terrimicrobiaceae bacterium]
MQTTASLWELLCRDFELERRGAKAEQCHGIALRFLQAAKRVLRSESPRLCDAFEIAGDACQAAGCLPDATANFEEALSKSLLLGSTPSAARLAAKLALVRDLVGELPEARFRYEQALSLYEAVRDYSRHVMLLNQLGTLCKLAGDFAAMEANYRRAMEVAIHLHDPNHPEVASAANNLGVAYTEAHDFLSAENLHMQALAIREKCFGAMHPDVAQSMANLAVVYHASGNYQKALAFYTGALKIYKCFRESDDPEMQTVIANHVALLEEAGTKPS